MNYHSKDLKDKVNEYDRKIIDVTNCEHMQHVAVATEMKGKSVDLENRTRGNNLRFNGFSESTLLGVFLDENIFCKPHIGIIYSKISKNII